MGGGAILSFRTTVIVISFCLLCNYFRHAPYTWQRHAERHSRQTGKNANFSAPGHWSRSAVWSTRYPGCTIWLPSYADGLAKRPWERSHERPRERWTVSGPVVDRFGSPISGRAVSGHVSFRGEHVVLVLESSHSKFINVRTTWPPPRPTPLGPPGSPLGT